MDYAYHGEQPFASSHFANGAAPPHGLLVIDDHADAIGMEMLADAAGLRLQALVPLSQATSRLDGQAGHDVVLLHCDRADPVLERLLVQLETLVVVGDLALIIVAGREALDLAFATARSGKAQLLCEPDMADLAAALVTATAQPRLSGTVHDNTREGVQLHELSAEVARLARTLDSLTGARRQALPSFPAGPRVSDRPGDYIGMPALAPLDTPATPLDGLSSAQVRDLLRARRLRGQFLPDDLFADPAWDMMLDLLAAKLDGELVSVSSLCIASAVPPTTALRWIRTLTDQALVERHADPLDGRRVFIKLADHAADALGRWFTSSRRLLAGALG